MKKFSQQNVSVIINPLAVANQPILSLLNTAFTSQGIRWQAFVTNKGDDLKAFTRQVLKAKPDVLYVLGGDGTQFFFV